MQPPESPAADTSLFDSLRRQLGEVGPAAAIDRLCQTLKDSGEYAKLFYALLLKKRQQMGVSPIPTAGAADMTPAQQTEYEDAVRDACRAVGALFLADGNIPAAFEYLRMIGEPAAVTEALESYTPSAEVDVQPIIEIAFH